MNVYNVDRCGRRRRWAEAVPPLNPHLRPRFHDVDCCGRRRRWAEAIYDVDCCGRNVAGLKPSSPPTPPPPAFPPSDVAGRADNRELLIPHQYYIYIYIADN